MLCLAYDNQWYGLQKEPEKGNTPTQELTASSIIEVIDESKKIEKAATVTN
ncbi:MAG: hypothetical protein ACI88A_002019 [Paraglaciecola sp.]|jgi:hypothetical protein